MGVATHLSNIHSIRINCTCGAEDSGPGEKCGEVLKQQLSGMKYCLYLHLCGKASKIALWSILIYIYIFIVRDVEDEYDARETKPDIGLIRSPAVGPSKSMQDMSKT